MLDKCKKQGAAFIEGPFVCVHEVALEASCRDAE